MNDGDVGPRYTNQSLIGIPSILASALICSTSITVADSFIGKTVFELLRRLPHLLQYFEKGLFTYPQ